MSTWEVYLSFKSSASIPRNMCDRFYRFCEFGKEIVYDREGATAFFVNDAEAHLLTWLQEGTFEERIDLQNSGYTPEEMEKGVEHFKSEGLFTDKKDKTIPYQDIPPMYTLTLNVTQQCNLRCKYCFVEKRDSAFMTEKVAKKAVDFILQFEDLKRIGVAFYGGEPLLIFPVVKSAMEYAFKEAEKKGIPVKYQITTNGTLLTDEIINFLTDYPVDVMVSMDGPASIHDAMRVTRQGEKTHAVVLKNLQKLLDAEGKHRVSVSGVVTNQGRLKDMYEYLSQFPLWDVKLSYVRYLDESEAKKYALSSRQKQVYLEDMRWLAQQCTDSILKGVRPPFYNFENIILQLWRHVKRGYFCLAGLRQFGISSRGDIYPCGPSANLGEWKLGTLKEGLDQTLVNTWTAHTSFEKDDCNQCWAQYLCIGGCPLQLVKTPEKECELTRYATQLAIAIYAAVKEKNEMMLASLINEEFLSEVRGIIKRIKS